MTKIALSIKGDWNDADYVEERHIMELDEVIIQKDQAGGLREVKAFEFFDRLAQSLKHFKGLSSHQYKHNWYNYEGNDDRSYQLELVEHFIDSIQYIDDKEQKQQAVEYVIELIEEFLPRADCMGIHSIVAIYYSPVESVTVLFGNP